MRHSDPCDLIIPALVRAKAEIALLPLVKDAQGDKAKYIRLGTLLAAIEPILLLHDCVLVQGCADDVVVDGVISALRVTTTLVHVSGQWIANGVLIPVQGPRKKATDVKPGDAPYLPPDAQAGGISLTYGRRYGIFALFSIAVDEDTDGAQRTQERRVRARGVAETVAERTEVRLAAMREQLNRDKVICACGAKQGQPHTEGCVNGLPQVEAPTRRRGVGKKSANRDGGNGAGAAGADGAAL